MYEKLEQCPVCKHTHFINHLICDDHSVTGESFALVKCDKCNLIFTNPRPEKKNLAKYYSSENYISHTDRANSPINFIYRLVRKFTLKQKIKLVQKYKKNGTLLDYGCGTGDFLQTATKNNWQPFGYEPDLKAKKIASEKNGNQIIESINTIDKVDVVTAWHVLEHVSDLSETVKQLRKILVDGGHLIIALPNHRSYDAAYYKEFWAAYDVPRHLYHFDEEAVKELARQFKFKIVKIHPMKFDSYYVSLLSEKYRKNGGIIKAIKTGYLSNKSAKKTNQYSSRIYVLQK
ncbi:class I SAM-dependent methyltransferase [Ekhidna sp.]|uniref:class I SAM-dependent methyltransferase n=1 Tax=Ekhidna sp. TaxID=2608089 RepID=UPI003BAA8CA2